MLNVLDKKRFSLVLTEIYMCICLLKKKKKLNTIFFSFLLLQKQEQVVLAKAHRGSFFSFLFFLADACLVNILQPQNITIK